MGVVNESLREKFISDPEYSNVVYPAEYINRILEHNKDNEEVIFTDKSGNIKITKSAVDKEVSDMSNDSFHTFFQELKTDMRERENRTRKEILEREERFEKQLERVTSENEKREERILNSIQSIESNIQTTLKEREDRINVRLTDTETRITSSLTDFEKRMSDHVKAMESMKWQNFWGTIAMFVGMLAIVITLIIAI